MRRRSPAVRLAIQRASGTATATIISWPVSTPRLNNSSAPSFASCGRPISASAPAKPKPCSSPKPKATAHGIAYVRPVLAPRGAHHFIADDENAERDHDFDCSLRQAREAQRRGAERDAVRDRERGERADQPPQRRHEQDQADHEEHVIDAAQDVLDAEHEVRRQHRPCCRELKRGIGRLHDAGDRSAVGELRPDERRSQRPLQVPRSGSSVPRVRPGTGPASARRMRRRRLRRAVRRAPRTWLAVADRLRCALLRATGCFQVSE